MTHSELCARAKTWLYDNRRAKFVLAEIQSGYGEYPDAIGFFDWTTILVECKATKSDFKNDAKKPFRKNPENGLGDYRFYMCPKGLIGSDEIPGNWGLLWVTKSQVRIKKKAIEIRRPLLNKLRCEMKLLSSLIWRAKYNLGDGFETVMTMRNWPRQLGVYEKKSFLSDINSIKKYYWPNF